jgi:histidinol-phosphate/aromatic aminotransferase/cobyric acid decarboxylase-like protein/choline kinase
MQAVILAAGFGNRMRPLTDNRHKTMLDIGDRTLLERMVDELCQHDVERLVIVTGYRDEDIRSFLDARYPALERVYVHNDAYRTTNNVHSLALAASVMRFDHDILLIECDLVFEPAVLARLVKSPHPNVALVDRWRTGLDGTVVTVEDGIVTSVVPPHLQGLSFDLTSAFKTLNMYKFDASFFETIFKPLLEVYAKSIDQNCYYELLLGMLIYMRSARVHAEILDGERWAEIDDANDLEGARFKFCPDSRQEMLSYAQGGYWNFDILDFCFLRNMYFPTPAMMSEIRTCLDSLLYNYGSKQHILNRKCAYFTRVAPEHIVALNGAAQIYPILRRLYEGQRFAVPSPTFGEYARSFPEAVLYDDGALPDGEGLDGLVVVNPNNPTGTIIESAAIYAYAQAHPSQTVIVDESFIDFTDETPIMALLEERPLDNVIVIKSLSKLLGVPGVRLGFVYSHNAEFIASVMSELPIWNMNSIAEFIYEILLKHRRTLAESFALTKRDRANFTAQLKELPLKEVREGGGNFVSIRLHDAIDLNASMLDKGIFVKEISAKYGAPANTIYRLAVRFPEEHATLITALREALSD